MKTPYMFFDRGIICMRSLDDLKRRLIEAPPEDYEQERQSVKEALERIRNDNLNIQHVFSYKPGLFEITARRVLKAINKSFSMLDRMVN